MSTEMPPRGTESGALQILATEHWSLLATRSLTYMESLGRVSMFLTILSGAVIALALVAQADRFGPVFITVAIFTLTVVFFTGIATVRRLLMLNRDDYKWVVGMNRLRHGYLALHPELEPNFITSPHDDLQGALQTLGLDPFGSGGLRCSRLRRPAGGGACLCPLAGRHSVVRQPFVSALRSGHRASISNAAKIGDLILSPPRYLRGTDDRRWACGRGETAAGA